MITKSNLLIDHENETEISNVLSKYINCFDIDYNIYPYDYFDIDEYELLAEKFNDCIKDDERVIDIFSRINFLYEVDLGTSSTSIERLYLPAITDLLGQKISSELHCNVLTGFKALKGDEDCYMGFFYDGKEIINLSSFDPSIWNNVIWTKSP
ncbi:hypothetical protein ABLB84_08170 [Xenorhabdus szentirmaii]|uniref:hypothetical protein n=1 Tax=Xenorhabdus szentirmaii TaxID=290112 RepID=UPI0032B790D6